MWVYHDLFFATRIQINVSWSGSGPGQMIRIQPDPDPKHWLGYRKYFKFHYFVSIIDIFRGAYLTTHLKKNHQITSTTSR